MNAGERSDMALCVVGLLLSLAAFDAPHPVVLALPGAALSAVMFVRVLGRLLGWGWRS